MIFGIDLGTTNSAIGLLEENQDITIVPDLRGKKTIPSVVAISPDGELVVGEVALEIATVHPSRAARFFKRHMGTAARYELGSLNFTAIELSTLVLEKLKELAEGHYKVPVNDVVISVPAYFNNQQRKATQEAAKLCGLNVVRLINEPTAAALAYSLQDSEEEAQIVVLDLGGGTFDISLLEKFDDVMEIRASGGDNFLGGEDFTKTILDWIVTEYGLESYQKEKHGLLYKAAESLKIQLNSQLVAKVEILIGSQKKILKIDRPEFERLASPLVKRIQEPIIRTMRDAKVEKSDVSHVVLVGGASRMWFFKKLATNLFGLLPSSHVDPDLVVAKGAAVQGMLLGNNKGLIDKVMTDVCPFTLGIEVSRPLDRNQFESGIFSPIIERNQTIPLSRVETYHPVHARQKELRINIYQGESLKTNNNLYLGELKVHIEKKPATDERVDVRFTYDVSGVLEVEAKVVSTGETFTTLVSQSDNNLDSKEIEERFKKLASIKRHPRDEEDNLLLISKAERLYEEFLDYRDYIQDLLMNFKSALETQDRDLVSEAREAFRTRLVEIEEDG